MSLKDEYDYFLKHKEELFKKYPHKFILVIENTVVGSFDTQEQALQEGSLKFKLGTFLIQKVSLDEGDVTQKFFSMVCF